MADGFLALAFFVMNVRYSKGWMLAEVAVVADSSAALAPAAPAPPPAPPDAADAMTLVAVAVLVVGVADTSGVTIAGVYDKWAPQRLITLRVALHSIAKRQRRDWLWVEGSHTCQKIKIRQRPSRCHS